MCSLFCPEDHSINVSILEDKKVLIIKGKVKKVFDMIPYDLLLINYSDDLSCFNKHRCSIEDKGEILNYINAWWMKQTKHIIDNHYLYHDGNNLLVKKCKRIDIEVIVRAYFTGSLFREGNATKYGIVLPQGLQKDQKFSTPIITPTTKDEFDNPLTEDDIVKRNLVTKEQWEYIKSKALELFEYGENISKGKGLILVDTKYEFGIDNKGDIILIDEMHTPDSSRFWNIDNKKAYDKDQVRNFVLDNPDTEIPDSVKESVINVYKKLYNILTNKSLPNFSSSVLLHYINYIAPLVIIIAGSKSDMPFVKKINYEFDNLAIIYHNYYHSAHKETDTVIKIINKYNNRKAPTVFVTVAGCSNALGGVVAANIKKPVINCPNYKDNLDMYINLNSSIIMPSGVPSSIVIRPDNLALFVKRVFDISF